MSRAIKPKTNNKTHPEKEFNVTPKRVGLLIASVVGFIFFTIFAYNMTVTVGAGEIVVKQGVVDGKLEVWTEPGLYCQCLGRVTVYKKSDQFWFSHSKDEGKGEDASIGVRFNDGGNGTISGSLSYDLPTDVKTMQHLHSTFGSQAAIEKRIIGQVVHKAVYMSGPLMSSKESAGERRSDLINFIADQASRGVYQTEKTEKLVEDVLSGEEKIVTVVEPVLGADGGFLREEKSPVEEFGIRIYNITIKQIAYDAHIEEQIKQQQQALMAVQTQMARSKEAEQKVLTVEKEGQAKAAEARWQQEVEKSKSVTNAEKDRDVQRLALETAILRKKEQIELGEGEAAYKRAVMEADGSLQTKLAAWVDVNKAYATALSAHPTVPSVMVGEGAPHGADLFQMMALKTAKDLGLEVAPKK